MKKIVRYVIIYYLLTMFNTNKEVKDDICRSRFALFINNIKRDIKRRRHHYREPSRIPMKALKALKHCGFVDKEKQNNDGYTRSMEINKATFMHHAKMPTGHLVTKKIRGLHVITDFRPPKKNMRNEHGTPILPEIPVDLELSWTTISICFSLSTRRFIHCIKYRVFFMAI